MPGTPSRHATTGMKRRRTALALVVLAALMVLTGCGLGKKPQAGTFDYSGTWRGSVNDETNGTGTFQATLQQAEFTLSGTWHTVLASDPARQDGGAFGGQLFVGKESDLLEVTLSPAVQGACAYKVTLSRAQDTMSGSYEPTGAGAACTNLTRGTLQVTKQK